MASLAGTAPCAAWLLPGTLEGDAAETSAPVASVFLPSITFAWLPPVDLPPVPAFERADEPSPAGLAAAIVRHQSLCTIEAGTGWLGVEVTCAVLPWVVEPREPAADETSRRLSAGPIVALEKPEVSVEAGIYPLIADSDMGAVVAPPEEATNVRELIRFASALGPWLTGTDALGLALR